MELEFKGTKGEWGTKWNSSTHVEIISVNGKSIAQINPYQNSELKDYPFEEYDANAKLIAAAPDLLEALQFCLKTLETIPGLSLAEIKAKEAIEKALK